MLVITATPLKSSKSTVWIAGGNLKDIVNLKSKEKGLEYASNYSELCRRFLKLPIPVIMSIDGAAIGGGAEFTLFGDLRIMTSRSTIQFKQLEMGLPCGFGGSSRLVQIVGNSRAMRWLFFGEKISADESIQSGFAHGVMSRHEESMSFIEDLMKRLDHIDPLAFAVQKNMLNKSQIDAADVHSYELNEFTKLWMETGHRKALKDFFARTHQNDTLNSEN
jgi:enoyl-CoA hydratase/carnithine racemase